MDISRKFILDFYRLADMVDCPGKTRMDDVASADVCSAAVDATRGIYTHLNI